MIQLFELTKGYGAKLVLDGITQDIDTGEFFVVLGPSGEGKSTLLKVIAGIERPDRGKIVVDGRDITGLPPEKRNIAMVFQNYALYPNMTVYDNIAFPLRMRGYRRQEIGERVAKAATLLGIGDILEKNVTKISGGQQQRVALARAIVRDPSFFLLDEPLSNLDARTRLAARGELKRIQRELTATFIYVTHDQKEAMSLASRVAVLHGGRFEQVADPRTLYDYPSTKWVAQFVGDFPMNFIPDTERPHVELGFRPEWVEEGGEHRAVVVSIEAAGEDAYLFCDYNGVKITLLLRQSFDIGDEVSFKIKKSRRFVGGKLEAPQIIDDTQHN
jgi:trehalose transport system ATP-binding protein